MTEMKKIERTLRELEKIQQSACPRDPSLIDRHNKKLERVSDYILELKEFINFHPNKFTVVTKNTFQELIDSGFAGTEKMGYIKIASVINYSEEDYKNYVWLTPIEDL